MKLSIENFKCFLSEEITFEDLTVLVGTNSSGKSSAIQALLILKEFFVANENIINEVVNKKALPRSVDLNKNGLNLVNSSEILNHNSQSDMIKFNVVDQNNSNCKLQYVIPNSEPSRSLNVSDYNDYSIDQNFFSQSPFSHKNTFHYLCAERLGPRTSQGLSNEENPTVGCQGEYSAHVIAVNSQKRIPQERCCPFPVKPSPLFQTQQDLWLNYITPKLKVRAEVLKQQNLATMKFILGDSSIVPTNTGFGISYYLPILTVCLLAPQGSIIIIENPEAHLCPRGQSRMGIFLGYMTNAGLRIIVETHSDHIVNGIRLAVKKSILDHNKAIFNYFKTSQENPYPEIVPIRMDNNSKLESWPRGFFDQVDQDLIALNQPSKT